MQTATITRTAEHSPAKLDPRLKPIVDHLVQQFELAMEKAVAHQTDSDKYPLPDDPTAMESLLSHRLDLMPAGTRHTIVSRMLPQLATSAPLRRTRLGVNSQLDLKSKVSLTQQARSLRILPAVQLTSQDFRQIATGPGVRRTITSKTNTEVRNLELQVHQLHCIADSVEVRNDEISIGGTMTNLATGDTSKVAPISIGKFKKGDIKNFASPLRLSGFRLQEGDVFPKTYLAVLDAAEIDAGGFSEFLDKLVDGIVVQSTVILTILAAGIGAGAGAGSALPALGTLIGMVAGAALVLIGALLKKLAGDEIFPPQALTPVTLGSLTDRFPDNSLESSKEILHFLGFGADYELTVSWRLS